MKPQSADGEVKQAEPGSEPTSSPVLRSDVRLTDDVTGPGRCGPPGPPASALPCHNSNNCTEKRKQQYEPLTPYRKKTCQRLISVVKGMTTKHGVNHVGLLTLTFGVLGTGKGSQETRELREQAKDLEFVQKRWHSFSTHVINKRYSDWACVLEQHKDAVWHFHVVVSVPVDIRTGTDVETLTNYKLPFWMRKGKHLRNEALAAEWEMLRRVCGKYHFGRTELIPIKKTGEALARYVAGYLSKSFGRVALGRRSRLVRLCRNLSRNFSMRFSPHNLGNLIHRTRLKIAASMLQFREYGDFADYFGSRWHYYIGDIIAAIPVPFKFEKGHFESGVATKVLMEFGENPFPYLDEVGNKKMMAIQSELLRKFTELAFDESAAMRWEEAQVEADDNIEVEASSHTQPSLFEASENPF